MKKPVTAALLSAFVSPGAGHFYLKKHIAGSVLFGVALISIFYLVSKILERASTIVDQILSGSIQPDITTIMELVSTQSTGPEAYLLNIATGVFITIWFIGIFDSYRVGAAAD